MTPALPHSTCPPPSPCTAHGRAGAAAGRCLLCGGGRTHRRPQSRLRRVRRRWCSAWDGALAASLWMPQAPAGRAAAVPSACCRRRRPACFHPSPPTSLPPCSCANLDAQILTRLPDLISDPGAAAGALALARYYLLGSGNLTAALQAAAGLDVPALQRRIEGARAELLQARRPATAPPAGPLCCAREAATRQIWLLSVHGVPLLHCPNPPLPSRAWRRGTSCSRRWRRPWPPPWTPRTPRRPPSSGRCSWAAARRCTRVGAGGPTAGRAGQGVGALCSGGALLGLTLHSSDVRELPIVRPCLPPAVYLSAKALVCCRALDAVGAQARAWRGRCVQPS